MQVVAPGKQTALCCARLCYTTLRCGVLCHALQLNHIKIYTEGEAASSVKSLSQPSDRLYCITDPSQQEVYLMKLPASLYAGRRLSQGPCAHDLPLCNTHRAVVGQNGRGLVPKQLGTLS